MIFFRIKYLLVLNLLGRNHTFVAFDLELKHYQ